MIFRGFERDRSLQTFSTSTTLRVGRPVRFLCVSCVTTCDIIFGKQPKSSKIQSKKDLLKQEIILLENIKAIKKTDDFYKALKQRSSLKKVIDDFFEKYQINDPNLSIKQRRLEILSLLRSKLLEIGNLYNLEG